MVPTIQPINEKDKKKYKKKYLKGGGQTPLTEIE